MANTIGFFKAQLMTLEYLQNTKFGIYSMVHVTCQCYTSFVFFKSTN